MMPEVARFDAYDSAANSSISNLNRSSLLSNMSTSSDDSLRKISNDSGISMASSKSIPPSLNSVSQFEEMIGEPRLSTEFSTAAMLQGMLAQQQQNLAAAALNPAMFGLMSAGLGGLWSNPLAAAAMLQQEVTARKLLESTNSGGKMSAGTGGKLYQNYYGSGNNLMQSSSPFSDQLHHSQPPEGLRESQMVNRKLSEDSMSRCGGGLVKPTRKSHSFNGSCSSLNRQLSPPTSTSGSPNNSNRLSPNRNTLSANGDDQQSSPYGDSDSMCSGKSSVRSPQPVGGHPTDNHSTYTAATTQEQLLPSYANHSHIHSAAVAAAAAASTSQQSRRRKNGIVGSMPLPDLSAYTIASHPAFPNPATGDIPLHKLSTASLPASLPSATGRNSIVLPDPTALGRSSPSTSRKRSRNNIQQPEEKFSGYQREDDSYWERRRKNNEAAKRSRDSRRAKEDETAIRAAFLEQENLRLRVELNKLKEEFSKLQTELDVYKKPGVNKPGGQKENSDKSVTDAESSSAAAPEPPTPPSAITSNNGVSL